MKIFTIGHSTRSFDEFVDILKHYRIELLIDIRRFPSSKKFPHFNKEFLEKELPANGIEYLHYPELGGFRKEGYENFAKTAEFRDALFKLLKIIDNKIVALVCAEILWWRCHRRFVSNKLTELGNEVLHIFNANKIQAHKQKQNKLKCD
ncbi:MAG: DUF488 domain-containing protein [Candidatus Aenigmatarchaeota archaeon]|nr:DUF488 domain-containing protein [Candidatus Aenigmarchaeota archaeon]